MLNEWMPIPGYGGKYEASFYGKVRRTYRTRPPRELVQFERKTAPGSRRLLVRLTDGAGHRRETSVARLVYMAHVGAVPEGCAVIHRNGLFSDNEKNNLAVMPRQELGFRYGAASGSRCVAKIAPGGAEVEFYPSAREAGRRNYMSYQTVMDRCNGVPKRGPAPDGYEYAWVDSAASLRAARKRIAAAGSGKQGRRK